MHDSSLWHMRDCVSRHLAEGPKGHVLEVGSSCGTPFYKDTFLEIGWQYTGADLSAQNNVDIVLEDPFLWDIPNGKFDAVISGQMLEHNQMFWLSFLEMSRVLKPGGLMIHIAPSRGPQHRAPHDCWRFYADGMQALAEWSGLDLIETSTDWLQKDIDWMRTTKPGQFAKTTINEKYKDSTWGDTVGVFRKPDGHTPEVAIKYMRTLLEKNAVSG